MARPMMVSLLLGGVLLGASACSDALETIDDLTYGIGTLIKTEPIPDSNNLNCTYRRDDGKEWTEQKVGECPRTDSRYL